MLQTLELERSSPGGPPTLEFGFGATPVGLALLAWNAQGIWSLAFVDADQHLARIDLQSQWPRASFVQDDVAASRLLARVFAPDGADGLTVVLQGTAFQRRVWHELLKIPRAGQVSYGEIARRLGQPAAARAVGSAVGANRVAYLIPCHRVARNNGQSTGFRWGLATKKRLCDWEADDR